MQLKPVLGPIQLVFYSVGIIIGAGVYTVIGTAAGLAQQSLWLIRRGNWNTSFERTCVSDTELVSSCRLIPFFNCAANSSAASSQADVVGETLSGAGATKQRGRTHH